MYARVRRATVSHVSVIDRHIRRAVIVVLCVTSACSSPVEGKPQALTAPGTVEASFLPVDDVSALVGATLVSQNSVAAPPGPLTADPPACTVAVGPATEAVYARSWQRFGSVSYQDSTAEHVVIQVLGAYPDESMAKSALTTLTTGLGQCKQAVRTNRDQGTAKWTYVVDATTDDSVAWTATQDGGEGWMCSRQARRTGKALLQVSVCQMGDGKQTVLTILDRFASRVTS